MSRIGKKVIPIPGGVTIDVKDRSVTVKGPLGTEAMELLQGIDLKLQGQEIEVVLDKSAGVERPDAIHGLSRAILANMVTGVSKGFEKDLEIVGVGYRATQQDKSIVLMLGFSHNVTFTPPAGVTVEVLDPTKLRVKGINKQVVGQVAANIRELRSPEPYKGKGIRYKNEKVRKKAGKTGKK
ncbi:MAG TPA: 50S ribosomal protein L6 [Spirochaetota bacterium]|nr:50S ribosomal protein L6 [Spirochaetota bacterium]OPZ38062.1 MAG: 50S ribosomal protein L6 [Spirochaetes bacterium ADurb.BinA120]HNU91903.1 50S ribosomal protein L6 [Spirochaetota bacterium]HPV97653.1 50S ribosomal protein L6 [Spirochaetota bacterium]